MLSLVQLLGAFAVVSSVFGGVAVDAACSPTIKYDLQLGSFGAPLQYTLATSAPSAGGLGYNPGIQVCTTSVTGSDPQFSDWAADKYDFVSTAFDNLVNRQYNGNFGSPFPMSVLASGDTQPSQAIIANRGISTMQQLSGKNIAVDSASSGYVLTFRAVAANFGVYNFNLIPVGGGTARNAALKAGNWTYPTPYPADPTLAGTTVDIHAGIVNGIQSITYPTDPYLQGPAVKVADLVNHVAPLQGASFAVKPSVLINKPAVANAIQLYLQASLVGQAFIQNPDNAAAVINYLKISGGTTTAYATQQYQAYNNPYAGIQFYDPNMTIFPLAALNVAYLRQRFGSFNVTYNPTNAPDQIDFSPLITNGTGQFVDYGLLNSAVSVFKSQIWPVKGGPSTSFTSQCVYPANGLSYTVSNAVSTVVNSLTGGCTNKPTVTFVSCTPSDSGAAYSDCSYNSANDSITVIAHVASGATSRTFTVTYQVKEACGYKSTIQQTITVYQTAQQGQGCVALAPPCQAQLQIQQTVQSSWVDQNNGPTSQYSVTLTNPSPSQLNTLTLAVSSADHNRISNIWSVNVDATQANTYDLPSYANGIAANGGSYSFGYIASGYNAVTFNPTATCQ